MNAFHVLGGLTAIWAVLVAVIGITREDFPRGSAEKVVGALSVVLVVATISAGLITSATEEEDEPAGAEGATQSESH